MEQLGVILRTRPTDCRHDGAYLARSQADQVGAWCDACKRWVTKEKAWHGGLWLPAGHPHLEGKRVTDLPIKPHAEYRVCEKCHTFQLCEVHHIAPRAFFGDDADAWPTVCLCRRCHETWHRLVTPGLCTPHDAVAHARMLFDYLGIDRTRALVVALKAEGVQRKAAA